MSEHEQHQHDHATDGSLWTAAFWDERYAGSPAVWSGNPNPRLVQQVAHLTPGTALDVGCGEGADAVWLAQQGWRVTGVDVSRVALERSAGHAADTGVEVRWEQVDVVAGEDLPSPYDLVSAQFLHPPPQVFDEVVGALGDAVAVGGTLLVVGHHPRDAELRPGADASLMMTPERIVAALDSTAWVVEVADVQAREQLVDGETTTVHDAVVRAVHRC